jgi:pyruvate dehydrogenase E1 component
VRSTGTGGVISGMTEKKGWKKAPYFGHGYVRNYRLRRDRTIPQSILPPKAYCPMITQVATTQTDENRAETVRLLTEIEQRLRWLSSWMIHNANHLRDKRDGLKVGGHQASCASMSAIMAALYFHALRPQDKVAVKPHAGPVLHAIHYLLATRVEKMERFRGLGGVQSYPSRTKDSIPVDFSTGSVGLGVAITAFSPAWCRII